MIDSTSFVDYDVVMEGKRQVNSCLPPMKRARYFSTVPEWNAAVKQGKVTSMEKAVKDMQERLKNQKLEKNHIRHINHLIKLKSKRIEKGYL